MKNGLPLYQRIAKRETYAQKWNDLPDKQRNQTTFEEFKTKESDKNVIAKGYGVFDMINQSHKKGFNKDNSRIWVKDSTDLNSEWKIFKK